MYLFALVSQSTQLVSAARLVFINWVFSLQLWLLMSGPELTAAFFAIDVATAATFYFMSRGKWFPVPLFGLHAILSVYHLCTMLYIGGGYWVQAILNRFLDIEILYIAACALFRIAIRRRSIR